MNPSSRRQRCYDHRLKELVRTSGDLSVAAELGVPRSTAMGRLCDSPQQVVTLDVLSLKEQQLQHEVLMLRKRVRKLLALLRLLLVLLRISGFSVAKERVPEGKAKGALLRAVDQTREFLPLRTVLRVLRLSPARYHSWRSSQRICSLEDRSSCPRTSPHQLTSDEIETIRSVPPCSDHHSSHSRPTARRGLCVSFNLVQAHPSVWMASASAACSSCQAQGWAAHH